MAGRTLRFREEKASLQYDSMWPIYASDTMCGLPLQTVAYVTLDTTLMNAIIITLNMKEMKTELYGECLQ